MMKTKSALIYAALISTAVITVISCAVNPVTGRKQIMLMSEAQEIQLGYHMTHRYLPVSVNTIIRHFSRGYRQRGQRWERFHTGRTSNIMSKWLTRRW